MNTERGNSSNTQWLIVLLQIFLIVVLGIIFVVHTQKEQNAIRKPTKVEILDDETQENQTRTFQTIIDWAKSVETSEPVLTRWNYNTKEGIILEDEQNYILQEGDTLVLCFNEKSETQLLLDFGIACKVGKGKNFYSILIREQLSEPTQFKLNLVVDNTEYEKVVYLQTQKEEKEN